MKKKNILSVAILLSSLGSSSLWAQSAGPMLDASNMPYTSYDYPMNHRGRVMWVTTGPALKPNGTFRRNKSSYTPDSPQEVHPNDSF